MWMKSSKGGSDPRVRREGWAERQRSVGIPLQDESTPDYATLWSYVTWARFG